MPVTRESHLEVLAREPRRWLVTGAAGFIGSHLTEVLLENGQLVVGLDNFATGRRENLDAVRQNVGAQAWERFTLLEGSLEAADQCARGCEGTDFVLHHAAMVSVPLSMKDPARCDRVNVGGFATLLEAARQSGVRRVVYATSSAVYGDASGERNREENLGEALSPYALTKRINEMQARFYTRTYGLSTTGLRYFNVFGPRQDPNGAYAAVIPRWIEAALNGQPCRIFGDGFATRDFCFVRDIVKANLLAALSPSPQVEGEIFNIGLGIPINLRELHRTLLDVLAERRPELPSLPAVFEPEREGDIKNSCAETLRAQRDLGFVSDYPLRKGLEAILGG